MATTPTPLPRPGVQVVQSLQTASPTLTKPTLAPVIVGAAFEVLNVLNSDGTVNSNAKYGIYSQLGSAVTESSFPDPRGNIDELDVQEDSIHVFLMHGGSLKELPISKGQGTAFLIAENVASAAAIQTVAFNGNTGLALAGTVLVLAIDVPSRLDTSKDITVTFTGGGNLTSAQAAAQINAAVGQTVATVVGASPTDKVQITSPTYGAGSSVTVRAGGSANAVLQIGYSGSSAAHEERVEGSGFRAQDQANNTTQSPWIEFSRGSYVLDGTVTAFVAKAGLVNVMTGSAFVTGQAAAITFGSSGSCPVAVGDLFFADGAQVQGGEISKVESGRFKVGTINTELSTADSNGNYISKVYNPTSFGTIFDPTPFEPKFAYFKAAGLDWSTAVATPYTKLAATSGTAATAGSVVGVGATFPVSLAGLNLHYVVTVDGVATEGTYVFTGGPYADAAAIVTALGTSIPGVAASVDASTPPQLKLTTSKTGAHQAVTIKKDGTANAALGFSTSADTTGTGTDTIFTGITGKTLEFQFDSNPHTYVVSFSTDSLEDAVTEINTVVGLTVASKNGLKLQLTSPLSGLASSVKVITQSPAGAETIFGIDDASTPTNTSGAGRPFPDAYLDDSTVLHIGSEILRDQVTGLPLDQTNDTGTVYIQYKALRLDVSAVAKRAGVLRIGDSDTLGTVLNPITDDNPLSLGMFLAMLNAPNFEIKGLGVDQVSAASPDGTVDAYTRAASMLEAEEVYAMALLTQDDTVHGLFVNHALAMSAADQGGERIVLYNKVMPTRANPAVAASGTQANSTATKNQMVLDVNPAQGLLNAGVNPAQPITVAMGVYLEFELDGELVRYNVSGVSGSLVTLNTTFASGDNTDAFYTTTDLTSSVIDAPYSLNVRGASLNVPGSNPARLDYSLVATNVSEANAATKQRRAYSVFPDQIITSVQGIQKTLPGYYACAAIAGQIAFLPPQQGLTNYPITGITGVVGTEKFTKSQLDEIAGGGTYILTQDVVGGPVMSRHQLSTDVSQIETRELSITKVVDFTAKFLRAGVRRYIGVNVINKDLLDTLGTTVDAILKFLEESGVLNGYAINQIVQDSSAPDTVLIDVTLDVPYPCNYIRLTVVV